MKTNVKLICKETIADGTMAFHFSKPDGFAFRASQCADFMLIDPPETDQLQSPPIRHPTIGPASGGVSMPR